MLVWTVTACSARAVSQVPVLTAIQNSALSAWSNVAIANELRVNHARARAQTAGTICVGYAPQVTASAAVASRAKETAVKFSAALAVVFLVTAASGHVRTVFSAGAGREKRTRRKEGRKLAGKKAA